MPASVDLGRKFEGFVDELVQRGRFSSRSDVLREGVRLVHERETRLAALDLALARGLADADAGRVQDIDDLAASLDARYASDT